MFAHQVIEQLEQKAYDKERDILIPIKIYNSPDLPREGYLIQLAALIQVMKPKRITLNTWPEEKMPCDAVFELFIFLHSNLKNNTSCTILLDLQNKSDEWINSLLHNMKRWHNDTQLILEVDFIFPLTSKFHPEYKLAMPVQQIVSQSGIFKPTAIRPDAGNKSYLEIVSQLRKQVESVKNGSSNRI